MKPNYLFYTHSTYSFHDAEQGNPTYGLTTNKWVTLFMR